MLQRDGACISLWQDHTQSYQIKNNNPGDRKFDVVIVGGGITGVSTALLLQIEGKKCALLESNSLCFGTTGGTTAHLNTVLDTPYSAIKRNFGNENCSLVANVAKEAIQLIKKNIDLYQINCGFEETSAFLFSQNKNQSKELEGIYRSCKELNIPIKKAKQIPVPLAFKNALEIKKQAKFNPTHYVMALAKEFEKAGGIVMDNCRVSGSTTDVHSIETSQGVFTADYLIYATHIPPGLSVLNFRCAPYRSYAMAVRLRENYPSELIYDMYDPYHYYRTQKIGRKNYFIVGGEDHKTGHQEDTQKCFINLENHIRKYFDVQEISHRWSSQYFESVDGLPYIGQLPGKDENILVATGFGGNGMIYSQVATMVFASLILDGQDQLIKLFDPGRHKPIAGFKNFVKENTDVLQDFLSKLVPAEKLQEYDDLQVDQAKIVKTDDGTVAIYKDRSGNFHAINPTCTHMHCNVIWNAAEKSWDCPCHGARYTIDGQVLTGPADMDLKVVRLQALEETTEKQA
ncbi:MAG: (2Fe-2S)-binding protein [Bacteroidetes bacterium]|nr:MAG: (2Fe-2S)-binding protein [Bacteroidota bacterium]